MNIKDIVELYDSVKGASSLDEAFEKNQGMGVKLLETLSGKADIATDVLFSRIPEEDLVKFFKIIQDAIVSAMVLSGNGKILVPAVSGELVGYTHTVVLTIIGLLVEEEIL